MTTHNIKFKEVDLEVEGYYTEGEPTVYHSEQGSHQGTSHEFEIHKISVSVDLFVAEITALFSENDVEELETEILEKHY